jgi:N-acyl-D-aspartate/D-glutamate deacylase
MAGIDLLIRGGCIYDGSDREGFVADIAVANGLIVEIGRVQANAKEEINADGLIVTPGFVDIHTHYDGQVTWEHRLQPSSAHGVTTAVMGNCGVGFAPCKVENREKLIALMEGVEDIPGIVMTEGLPWNWESFPDYLDVVGGRTYDMDVAAQLPHSCLRVQVMGQRAIDGGDANSDDLRQMESLTREAVAAGAIGFSTSRSTFHRDRNGTPIPTKRASEAELQAIVSGLRTAGSGVIEALIDFADLDQEFGLLRRLAERNGRLLTLTVSQIADEPDAWRRALELIEAANRSGVAIKGQVMGRPMGMFVGLSVTFNPFSLRPSYQQIAHLPLKARVIEMRHPELKARILGEASGTGHYRRLDFLGRFDCMYVVDDPPSYDQTLDDSLAAQARQRGVTAEEFAYDTILEDDGERLVHLRSANFVDGTLDVARALITNPYTLLGLGDGGAHYGMVCDAGFPSFMLAYWGRDRRAEDRLSLPWIVRSLSRDNADAMGLQDRGRIALGYKADLNVIDIDRLKIRRPRTAFDLPAGGRRLLQDAEGFAATIVSGSTTYLHGQSTGALPGRLVRGPQRPALTHKHSSTKDAGTP